MVARVAPHGATQNHTRGLLGAKRGADHQIKLCRELVTSGGNLGVSESSRPAQIELAEISGSLCGCLLDACAPSTGTPSYHSLQNRESTSKKE
jgi:hypothetical protein